MGNPSDSPWDSDFIEDILSRAEEALKKSGTVLGAFLPREEDVAKGIRHGCSLLAVANDQAMIMSQSGQVSKAFRALL